METLLKQICALACSIAHAPRASICYHDEKKNIIRILAASGGQREQIPVKYGLPFSLMKNRVALVQHAKNHPLLRGHPIFELMPSLGSLATYFVSGDEHGIVALTIWNPAAKFFTDDYSLSSADLLVDVLRAITQNPPPIDEPLNTMLYSGLLQEEIMPLLPREAREPVSQFLFDTLCKKQRLLGRNGCSYLAMRTWRKAIKEHQISALTAIKAALLPRSVDRIVDEMAGEIMKVYGRGFDAVVPVPTGSSGNPNGLSCSAGTGHCPKNGSSLCRCSEIQIGVGQIPPPKKRQTCPF